MSEINVVESQPESAPPLVTEEAQTNENDVAIVAIQEDGMTQRAAIHAEAEIAITEANAEARTAEAEANADAATAIAEEEGNAEWRLNKMEADLAEMKGLMQSLVSQPPISLPPTLEAEPEAVTLEPEAETDLIPQSTSAETSETLTEAIQESVADGPEIPPIIEVAGKPVIRLV